jgi:hypothetical protein
MDWFNRLSTQHDKSISRKTAIEQGLEVYWTSLVTMIQTGQSEFHGRYGAGAAAVTYTTGFTAPTPAVPSAVLRRTAAGVDHTVTIAKQPPRISANFSDPIPAVILEVILDDNGAPVLQSNNRRITIDEACERIARPILFPDLG